MFFHLVFTNIFSVTIRVNDSEQSACIKPTIFPGLEFSGNVTAHEWVLDFVTRGRRLPVTVAGHLKALCPGHGGSESESSQAAATRVVARAATAEAAAACAGTRMLGMMIHPSQARNCGGLRAFNYP